MVDLELLTVMYHCPHSITDITKLVVLDIYRQQLAMAQQALLLGQHHHMYGSHQGHRHQVDW